MNDECIEILKRKVEEKLGRQVLAPTDFSFLSSKLSETVKENLSVSTLKRLWGYVVCDSVPSSGTLSILSRYIGYNGWDDFCSNYRWGIIDDSDFLSGNQIPASKINKGDKLELSWDPDRRCTLVCLGNERFRVEESANSKLRPGDTFRASIFCVHQPLFVTDLRRGDCPPRTYVAARRNGLREVKLSVCLK